jgi:hypothetical protein
MCDMNGTFALQQESDITWDPVTLLGITLLAGGSDTTTSWGLRHYTVSGSTLQMDSTPCGGTAPDICSPFFKEAYAQTVPNSVWDSATVPVTSASMTLTDPDPGDAFNGPLEYTILGVTLTSPTGAWPTAWNAAGITWVDPDNDTHPGVSVFVKTTGTSVSCGFPYAALPDPSNSNGPRLATVYTGSRGISSYVGHIVDCNTIKGTVNGPVNGFPEGDGRVRGCTYVNGTQCSATTYNSLDSQANTNNIHTLSTSFTMVRVPSTTTCTQVRAMTFPQ